MLAIDAPVILPPDGDMSAYMDSLEKLFAQDFERIAPGHGDLIGDAKQALRALRAHRLAREDKVVNKLGVLGAASIEVLTPDFAGRMESVELVAKSGLGENLYNFYIKMVCF